MVGRRAGTCCFTSLHTLSLLLARDKEEDGLFSSDASSVGLRKEIEGRGGLLSWL